MTKIRLGVIGCGGMAGSHANGLMELSDLMEVTVTCDIDLNKAKQAAERVQAKRFTTDYREMLDEVDAVLIALPHDLHFEVGQTCLKAGKHVLMEKPMCNTEEECIKLIETAEKCDRVLMTAYPVRYWPAITKMKEWIDTEKFGKVFQMSVWTEQFTRYYDGHWALSADRLGGGQFFSHGCHYVDLMLWFLGRPVRGFHMGTNTGTPWMENEGTSNATLEFEGGVLGYHFGTWGARGTRLGWSLHVHCTEGMIEYKRADGKVYLHSHIKEEKANLDTSSRTQILFEDDDAGKQTQHETRHFLECIRKGIKPLTDGPGSLQGLRVIWRLYEAERANQIANLRGLGLDEDWKLVH